MKAMHALLKKEIRTRMRGNTIFVMENAYLLLLVGAFLIALFTANDYFGWTLGRDLFVIANSIQILLLVLASPTLVASTFTLEREQKTLDMLLATPIPVGQIALAKLFASLSLFFVLMLISIPVMSVCFIFGGISPAEIAWAYLITLMGIVLAGVIGLDASVHQQKTFMSVPISSLAIVALLISTYVGGSLLSPVLGLLNPLYAFFVMMREWNVKFFEMRIPFWAPTVALLAPLSLAIFFNAVEDLKEEKRKSLIWPRFFFFLFFVALLTFYLGSTLQTDPLIGTGVDKLGVFGMAAFIGTVTIAVIGSSGKLTEVEQAKLSLSWKQRYLTVRGWFGPGLLVGAQFSALLALAVAAVFAVGVYRTPAVEHKLSTAVLVGGLIILATSAFALIGRIFSLLRKTSGKVVPPILTIVLAVLIMSADLALLAVGEAATRPDSAWQALILTEPFTALVSMLAPERTLSDYPYCKAFLHGVPFAAATNAFYAILLLVAAFLNTLVSRRAARRGISSSASKRPT
ncbi:MAG: hypothetical protein Kow0099_02120 [Candidatus Abyssubacteria bacterium]